MKGNAFHLPDTFTPNNPGDIYIHHYQSAEPNVRHKIVLSQNLVCILVKGTKQIFGSHDSIRIDSSEILFLTSGSVLMWESMAEDDQLESFLIFFSNSILREFRAKHAFNVSKAVGNGSSFLALKKDDFLRNYQSSLRLLRGNDFLVLQKVKLEELLVYLMVNNYSKTIHGFIRKALVDSKADRLRQVVLANANNGLTIAELAFLCNMSVSTFKRKFAKAFKCTPKKYLTKRKMDKARELLLLDNRPSDIYANLRYQSLSSFSTEFKKYFGTSPKRFQLDNLV
jgi:AraC-like DNA-binding protein